MDFVVSSPAEHVVINKLTNATQLIGLSHPDYHCTSPDAGSVVFDTRCHGPRDTVTMSDPERQMLSRTDWALSTNTPKTGCA